MDYPKFTFRSIIKYIYMSYTRNCTILWDSAVSFNAVGN